MAIQCFRYEKLNLKAMGFLIDTGSDTRLTQQIIVVTRYMTNFTRPIHPIVTDCQNHYYTDVTRLDQLIVIGTRQCTMSKITRLTHPIVIVRKILCNTIHHLIDLPDYH